MQRVLSLLINVSIGPLVCSTLSFSSLVPKLTWWDTPYTYKFELRLTDGTSEFELPARYFYPYDLQLAQQRLSHLFGMDGSYLLSDTLGGSNQFLTSTDIATKWNDASRNSKIFEPRNSLDQQDDKAATFLITSVSRICKHPDSLVYTNFLPTPKHIWSDYGLPRESLGYRLANICQSLDRGKDVRLQVVLAEQYRSKDLSVSDSHKTIIADLRLQKALTNKK